MPDQVEKERIAGVWSLLPAASVARTRRRCGPWPRARYVFGELQACHAPWSSWHSNVLPCSEEENESVVDFPWTETEVIVVLGATVSTFQVLAAGDRSFVPAESLARTSKVCEPCGRPVKVFPDVHDDQLRSSSLHWKVAAVSSDENRNVADVDEVGPLGPDVRDVWGGRSTRHE